MFDAFDESWWSAGSALNWWDSHVADPPAWLPGREEALAWLERHAPVTGAALALIRSYRTCETSQLHELDPRLPADPRSTLWMMLAGMRLIDLGFPINVNGRGGWGPKNAGFMAVRLPVHHAIDPELRRLGLTPAEIADIGPGPLRGQRQYDRHNLICTGLAVRARRDGWLTAGEAWCRFDRICDDPIMGHGGPDLALIGEGLLVCVELTASTGQSLETKFRRWDRVLDHPACRNTHVLWLSAGRGDGNTGILERLDGLCAARPRQHAGDAASVMAGGFMTDGWTPSPGIPVPLDGWTGHDMDRLGRVFGLPNAASWRLPERMRGHWHG